MSIPVERRELNDGWVLTCRGESGGDLTLSDVIIKRENLCCQVLGGETMFFPMLGQNHADTESLASGMSQSGANSVMRTVCMTLKLSSRQSWIIFGNFSNMLGARDTGKLEQAESNR